MFVKFKSHVFEKPYTPFYDKYKGHTFKVVKRYNEHFALICTSDPSITVDGIVEQNSVEII